MIQKMMMVLVCCLATSQANAQGVWDALATRLAGYETRIAAAVATMGSLETDRDTLEARLLAAIQCDCCSSELEAANAAGFALGQAINTYGTEYAMITTNVTTCQGHWPACLDPVACSDDLDYLALATTSLEGKVTAAQTALTAFETAIEAYEACLEVTLTSQATIDALSAALDEAEAALAVAGGDLATSLASVNGLIQAMTDADAEYELYKAHRCPAAVNNSTTTDMANAATALKTYWWPNNPGYGSLQQALGARYNSGLSHGLYQAELNLGMADLYLENARNRLSFGVCLTPYDIAYINAKIANIEEEIANNETIFAEIATLVAAGQDELDDFMVAFYNYKAYIILHCGPLP